MTEEHVKGLSQKAFKETLNTKLLEFETKIDDFFDYESEREKKFNEQMLYSLRSGKRIRGLVIEELSNDDPFKSYFSVALECIHAYSLIHDDLPCMDDDNLRRGKPTNHVVYGEGQALLAGDALLNYAYEMMLKAIIKSNYQVKYIKSMDEIAKAAGKTGMIIGQVADMENSSDEEKEEKIDKLKFINTNKTGKIITAAFVVGGILGDYTEEEIEKLRYIGMKVGYAFQIKDDLLDIYGDEAILGKPINSDLKNDKLTYPMIMGQKASEELLNEYEKEIFMNLEQLDVSDFLLSLTEFSFKRNW